MQTFDDTAPVFDPLELYASGIDTSDYTARVAPLMRGLVPAIGDLLDIGAGGGQLGAAIREPGRLWSAIEPSPTMQARLARLPDPPRILPMGWDAAAPARHDTVMAANMPAPLTSAQAFLARCRAWSSRRIIWLVPSQHGPRGLCLAGCLPPEWHGEDETPGIEIVLGQLEAADHPHRIVKTDWSFRLRVRSIPRIAAYLAGRLGWAGDDPRRADLAAHLARAAEPAGDLLQLTVPRQSAILVWGQT